MPLMELKLPRAVLDGLVKVASLSDANISDLIQTLTDHASKFREPDFPSVLAAEFDSVVPKDDALAIIKAVLALYSVWASSSSRTLSEIAENASQSVARERKGIDEGRLKLTLQSLLSITPLEAAVKAIMIIRQHHNVYMNARVFTDVRSVFADDVDRPPLAAVIVHNLTIRYGECGQARDIQLAMDYEDLSAFIKVLQRAQQKDATIRRVLAEAKLTHLENIG